jgi:Rhodanese-related sulfurtransferase
VISAAEAVRERAHLDPIILDATLHLAEAEYDGDYRAASGRTDWLDERIAGAWHIDLLHEWIRPHAGFHFAAPEPDAFADELGQAGIDGTRAVWLYDRSSQMWASRLWWTLRNAGVAAQVIDGGLAGWRRAGGAVDHGRPAERGPEPVSAPRPQDLGLWVDRREVEALLDSPRPGDPALICALSPEAMWGRVPTRYTRRGHIPGSLNLPGHSVLGSDRTLLNGPGPDALAGTGLEPEDAVILYCGGGISASLAGLALVHWGFSDVRIYDGSLEEWSADPSAKLVSDR